MHSPSAICRGPLSPSNAVNKKASTREAAIYEFTLFRFKTIRPRRQHCRYSVHGGDITAPRIRDNPVGSNSALTRQRHDLLLHLVESVGDPVDPAHSVQTYLLPPVPAHSFFPLIALCSCSAPGVTDSNAEPAVRNENILGKGACRGTDLLNGS